VDDMQTVVDTASIFIEKRLRVAMRRDDRCFY
jgi:hypothetical protein